MTHSPDELARFLEHRFADRANLDDITVWEILDTLAAWIDQSIVVIYHADGSVTRLAAPIEDQDDRPAGSNK